MHFLFRHVSWCASKMIQTKHRATMQRPLSFANSIEQVLLPCTDSLFPNSQNTFNSWALVVRSSDSRLLDTWRPGIGKQKQHQWQCVQRCVPGLPEHSLLTERVHVQLASYRFVLKLGTSWHNDVLHATPNPTLLKMEFEGGEVVLKFHFKIPFVQHQKPQWRDLVFGFMWGTPRESKTSTRESRAKGVRQGRAVKAEPKAGALPS